MLKIGKGIAKDFEIAQEQIAEFSFTSLSMSWFENVQFEALKKKITKKNIFKCFFQESRQCVFCMGSHLA